MSLMSFCCSHLLFSLLGDFLTQCSGVKNFPQCLFPSSFPPSRVNSPFPVSKQTGNNIPHSFQPCFLSVKHQFQALSEHSSLSLLLAWLSLLSRLCVCSLLGVTPAPSPPWHGVMLAQGHPTLQMVPLAAPARGSGDQPIIPDTNPRLFPSGNADTRRSCCLLPS